jgi:hypothetical protein
VLHGQRTANGIAVGIAMREYGHILWYLYELAKFSREFHKSAFKKAGKSKALNAEMAGKQENIFSKTFFTPTFEIKSCTTFASLDLHNKPHYPVKKNYHIKF